MEIGPEPQTQVRPVSKSLGRSPSIYVGPVRPGSIVKTGITVVGDIFVSGDVKRHMSREWCTLGCPYHSKGVKCLPLELRVSPSCRRDLRVSVSHIVSVSNLGPEQRTEYLLERCLPLSVTEDRFL